MTPEERLEALERRVAFLEGLYAKAQEFAKGPGKKLLKMLGVEKLP
jgi:hypothetical protein